MAHTLRSRDVCDSLSHSPHRAHTRDSQSGTHTLHTRCACTKAQDVQWQAVIKPSRRRVVHVGARRRRRRRRRPWMRGRQARASASERRQKHPTYGGPRASLGLGLAYARARLG